MMIMLLAFESESAAIGGMRLGPGQVAVAGGREGGTASNSSNSHTKHARKNDAPIIINSPTHPLHL